jgi:hypothetical protein
MVCHESGSYRNVATSLAVLAGIAASDAACCVALGRRSRGQDHLQAVDLVATVEPGGKQAAKDLYRLLDLKDASHYGVTDLGAGKVLPSITHARRLVTFARSIIAG